MPTPNRAAASEHIPGFLHWFHHLRVDERHHAMQRFNPGTIVDILSDAARMRPAPGTPQSARPLVGELFDALPSETLLRCVASQPERTAHAAAMGMDLPSLGRVFDTALAAGPTVCARISEVIGQHGQALFEHVLRQGDASHIANLLRMTSHASPQIRAEVQMRAAEYGRSVPDLTEDGTPSSRAPSPAWSDIARGSLGPIDKVDFREVNWAATPTASSKPPREPGTARLSPQAPSVG